MTTPCSVSHCGEGPDFHLHAPSEQCQPCYAPQDHHTYIPSVPTVTITAEVATRLLWAFDIADEETTLKPEVVDAANALVASLTLAGVGGFSARPDFIADLRQKGLVVM